MITREMQNLVLKMMVALINKKGSRKKMVSPFEIETALRENGVSGFPLTMIRATLEEMVGERKVRYFRNERGYLYYGIPTAVWEQIDNATALK